MIIGNVIAALNCETYLLSYNQIWNNFQRFQLMYDYTSNFHPVEGVGRGSETQLQVGENLNRHAVWLSSGI